MNQTEGMSMPDLYAIYECPHTAKTEMIGHGARAS